MSKQPIVGFGQAKYCPTCKLQTEQLRAGFSIRLCLGCRRTFTIKESRIAERQDRGINSPEPKCKDCGEPIDGEVCHIGRATLCRDCAESRRELEP